MGKVTPPPLTNETLNQRLLTGNATKGGARGSLTRCATKLGALNTKLNAPGGSTDLEIQTIKEDIKREVRLFQVEMHKWMIMIQAAEKELKDVTAQEQQMADAVEQKQRDIQELRNQATKVARTRKCWTEYETLAKLARQRSPCRVLRAKMDKANADLEKTKNQLYHTAAESKVREKQFHLLIQCMLDLKRSLGEAVEIPPKKKEGEDEEEEEEKEEAGQKPTAVQKEVKQDIEAAVQPTETEDNDEDDEDLYGGL